MKPTTSTFSPPEPAVYVDQQAGSDAISDRSASTFNGMEISTRQPCRRTATNAYERISMEVAYWQNKPLQGRQITPAAVLNAYGNDTTSLRSGVFLQKLCLRNIPHNNRQVIPDQVVQEFNRQPDQNNEFKLAIARFKAECCLRGLPLNGQPVTPDEVYKDFMESPAGSEEITLFNTKRYLNGHLLADRQVDPGDDPEGYAASTSQHQASAAVRSELPLSDNQVPQLNVLTRRALEMIQEINESYNTPPILITGSYARFLQNRCTSFKDIDIICSTEDSAMKLFKKMQALKEALDIDRDLGANDNIFISPMPGCRAIQLPKAYTIHPKDSSSDIPGPGLMVSIDGRVINGHAAPLAISTPGVERPLWCLSFAEETRLLNDTLEHLIENLNPLTVELNQGPAFELPRTILFGFPKNGKERIYGLLVRALLTLDKARQFISIFAEEEPDGQLQAQRQRLHALAAILQRKLSRHICRSDFECRVSCWLSTVPHVSNYEIKRMEFITSLLKMMHPELDRIDSTH
ncbi:hypothetical protein [Salinisphaera sp. G21_0]|uniref:hypothetical protein n=1 Tax=Salinisphaera sp. G21_0 TaxID=2821094 RepID=UPI001AD99870|nr:hypothetical protein [Salinisphaera sp. G21_0]MBO9482301.1 hypothetical protein [Salinisphaera sp. G21_0]